MKGVTSSPNPMRLNEIDHFDYSTTQSTALTTGRNMKLKQTQQSSLSASYHQSLTPDIPLKLGTDNSTQNYRYLQIEDHASSEVSIAYADNKLVSASLAQSSSQTTNIKTYQLGILTNEQNSPRQHSTVRDLLETLETFEKKDPYEKPEARQLRLSELNSQIFLN